MATPWPRRATWHTPLREHATTLSTSFQDVLHTIERNCSQTVPADLAGDVICSHQSRIVKSRPADPCSPSTAMPEVAEISPLSLDQESWLGIECILLAWQHAILFPLVLTCRDVTSSFDKSSALLNLHILADLQIVLALSYIHGLLCHIVLEI
jgi:hypothetical protein